MLTRPALARVLQSLMTAELASASIRRRPILPPALMQPWPDGLLLDDSEDADATLGCDSLDRLRLAAAVNEMFHLHEANQEGGLLADFTFGAWLDRIQAIWRDGVSNLTFVTSGSTGQPKRCRHEFRQIEAEIAFLADHWRDRCRIVAMVPAHHIYGFLFTAVLPDVLGIPCFDTFDMGPGPLSQALRSGDLVVTFPERWHWLDRSLASWPADIAGVVSTAPCPTELIQSLVKAGVSGMTEVYGSTETGGIATREWPEESYRLMPQWRFASVFIEEAPTLDHRLGYSIRLMDSINRTDETHFVLAGRRDGMVQVGGVNVAPDLVAAKLRARPHVADAAVRLMRPEEGSRLKAYIVLEAGANADAVAHQLHTWMRSSVKAAERATELTFGASLPTNVMGKALDW